MSFKQVIKPHIKNKEVSETSAKWLLPACSDISIGSEELWIIILFSLLDLIVFTNNKIYNLTSKATSSV